jgi:hypothetical protein
MTNDDAPTPHYRLPYRKRLPDPPLVRMTAYPNGTALIEIENYPVGVDAACGILRLMMNDRTPQSVTDG